MKTHKEIFEKLKKKVEKGCGGEIYTVRKGCVFCGDSEGFTCGACMNRVKEFKESCESSLEFLESFSERYMKEKESINDLKISIAEGNLADKIIELKKIIQDCLEVLQTTDCA